MRACWRDDVVDHDGERFHYEGLKVSPKPPASTSGWAASRPPSCDRVGRLADGWLPSFLTPTDAAAGRAVDRTGRRRARSLDRGGPLRGAHPVRLRTGARPAPRPAGRRRPDLDDPAELIPVGWDALIATIKRFVDVGTTKFVVLPIVEPEDVHAWRSHLGEAAEALLPLEK